MGYLGSLMAVIRLIRLKIMRQVKEHTRGPGAVFMLVHRIASGLGRRHQQTASSGVVDARLGPATVNVPCSVVTERLRNRAWMSVQPYRV